MLGLPPMNQFDATATPMFDCFTNTPDYTAFAAVTNNVPLDEMEPVLAESVHRNPDRVHHSGEIRETAMEEGMPTLRDDACSKVLAGQTTIEEVIRVISG